MPDNTAATADNHRKLVGPMKKTTKKAAKKPARKPAAAKTTQRRAKKK